MSTTTGSTSIDHLVVANVYGYLAELEGGSYTAFAIASGLDDHEFFYGWTEVQVNAALWYLERKGLVVFDGSPAGLLWSLAEIR